MKSYKPQFTFLLIALLQVVLIIGCNDSEKSLPDPFAFKQFESFSDFQKTLSNIVNISNEQLRLEKMDTFWDSLKANHQIPFIYGDSIALLYKGEATTVKWAGDFNGWNPNLGGFDGTKQGETNIWMVKTSFPQDARLDYKIVINGSWVLDSNNPHIQYSGFGPNSEIRMPQWIYPDETKLAEGASRGSLSENNIIQSKTENLGYKVNYRVYTPFGYNNLEELPVIYVTDGHEYADDRLGAMITVMDNLIYQNKIDPLIAIFIDPRDPNSLGNNRRMNEYRANIRFANFLASELVPAIDANYRTNPSPSKRAILGTSLGGWNSAYVGFNRSETFQLIAIHSPAFDSNIIQSFSNSPVLPMKIFMSTGTIYDTQLVARQMRDVLNIKGYPLRYIEKNEGHSWGNWRALIDEPLLYFFPKTK